jgi:DamX protein
VPTPAPASTAQAVEGLAEGNAPGPLSGAEALLLQDQDWIMAQEPDRYTIQVIALSAPEKLRALIDGHAQRAPFASFTVRRDGATLHVLLQGDYADVNAARRARDYFPPEIQRADRMWIRQFGMVQDQIRGAQ